ncbi:BglG family transcription antiterminator [Streptococcus zalophi]|uniref:BglG family transcription antiterminator n=1 Tax=Streptococcus zalophi TaxID=640031 RepID=UPI00215CB2EF|nr:PTS sugar transporter subunit IIA [Streptococcus zalophi]MCR8966997.1 PTS sugar transporter subunit IIA [Streptococcus zalophi]
MNHRQEQILKVLFQEDDYISAQFLADKYHVSTKTIYNDLATIKDYLAQNNVILEKIPRHGIRIIGEKNYKQATFQKLQGYLSVKNDSSFSDREDIYIKELFLTSHSFSLIDFSLELFISESSIRRDLDKIELILMEYNCSLIRQDGYVSLKGEEKDIRYFLRNFIFKKYLIYYDSDNNDEILTKFFSLEDIRKVNDVIEKLAILYTYFFSEQYKIYLILDLLIFMSRFRQNFVLTHKTRDPLEDMKPLGVYPLASDMLSRILEIPNEKLLSEEVRQIAFTILSVGYMNKSSNNKEFQLITNQLIKRVGDLLGINLNEDEELVKMVTNHIGPMIYRLKKSINIANQMTEEIKKNYSILYNVVWLAAKVISDQYHLKLLDAEIAFLTIYFEIAVEKLEKPLNIIVICPHGLATSELIISSLRRVIANYDHIIKIDFKELNQEIIQKSDIIISSIRLENVNFPYILVSPILTNDELDDIQKQYLNLTKGNRKVLSMVHDNYYARQTLLKNLIQNSIFLNKLMVTKEECIEFLVNQSVVENRNNKNYLLSIFQREKLGSTSVYTGIALPHANPEAVSYSQLLILTLAKPIVWDNNEVKVVMLISIKEGEENIYKDALVHLYSKIDNQEFIDQLSKIEKSDVFLSTILEGRGKICKKN